MSRTFALSIVVPVYNGANSVGALVDALAGLEIPGGHEIVLVNDGSPDNSRDVCLALVRRTDVPVTLVDLARNFGEHNAVMAGLSQARGSFVITMDDDLQNPPEEVVRLFLHARDHRYDVVYTYYAEKQHAWWRNLGSRFTNWCADQLLDKPKGLYLSSFRCVAGPIARQVAQYGGPYPYIDGLLSQYTQRIGTLTVHHDPRLDGESNYNMRRLVRLWLTIFTSFSIMPLRLASLLGLALAVTGLLAIVILVVQALVQGVAVAGWLSIISAILILGGLQCLLIGVLGEYLGRIFLTDSRDTSVALTSW